jgi:hypothetical protein
MPRRLAGILRHQHGGISGESWLEEGENVVCQLAENRKSGWAASSGEGAAWRRRGGGVWRQISEVLKVLLAAFGGYNLQ